MRDEQATQLDGVASSCLEVVSGARRALERLLGRSKHAVKGIGRELCLHEEYGREPDVRGS